MAYDPASQHPTTTQEANPAMAGAADGIRRNSEGVKVTFPDTIAQWIATRRGRMIPNYLLD